MSVVELFGLMQGCKVVERNTFLEEVDEKSMASADLLLLLLDYPISSKFESSFSLVLSSLASLLLSSLTL